MRGLCRRLALAAHHLATSGEALVYLVVATLAAVTARLLVVVGALALVLLVVLATVSPAPAGQGCPLCARTVRKAAGR